MQLEQQPTCGKATVNEAGFSYANGWPSDSLADIKDTFMYARTIDGDRTERVFVTIRRTVENPIRWASGGCAPEIGQQRTSQELRGVDPLMAACQPR